MFFLTSELEHHHKWTNNTVGDLKSLSIGPIILGKIGAHSHISGFAEAYHEYKNRLHNSWGGTEDHQFMFLPYSFWMSRSILGLSYVEFEFLCMFFPNLLGFSLGSSVYTHLSKTCKKIAVSMLNCHNVFMSGHAHLWCTGFQAWVYSWCVAPDLLPQPEYSNY